MMSRCGTKAIDVERLRAVLNLVLDGVKARQGKAVALEKVGSQYFWEIDLGEVFDIENDPKLAVGSLTDSFEFLETILADDLTPQQTPSLMAVHLVPLLLALAKVENG